MICLQGGAEFGSACREMDAHLLDLAGDGPVVVLPVASVRRSEATATVAHAARWYRALGAGEVRSDPDALADAAFVVLPGGSPQKARGRLLGTDLGGGIAAAHARGAVVMGASAGAMVLAEWMLLPAGRGSPACDVGLGLAAGLCVVPHYAKPRPTWERAAWQVVPGGIDLIGLPECSGVLLDSSGMVSLGAAPSVVITREGERLQLAL